MKTKKKFDLKIIAISLIVILLIAGGVYAGIQIGKRQMEGGLINRITPSPKSCTSEAKICPDGTEVGRVGPNCEFAPCPSQLKFQL